MTTNQVSRIHSLCLRSNSYIMCWDNGLELIIYGCFDCLNYFHVISSVHKIKLMYSNQPMKKSRIVPTIPLPSIYGQNMRKGCMHSEFYMYTVRTHGWGFLIMPRFPIVSKDPLRIQNYFLPF